MSAPATTSPTPATAAAPAAAPATTPAAAGSNSAAAPAAANAAAAPATSGNGTFQSASLYVGDLHSEITEGLLFEMFNRVGPVASIRVCRDAVTRRSLGYAYVNFHDVQDAERALDTMQFTEIKGKACRIMWSQRDPSLRKSGVGNIFVKNLAKSVDNKNLFDIFSMFGNILSCKVAVSGDDGESKGYGYVHFETAEAAQEAVAKLNGASIDDSEVTVTPFVRVQERAGQPEWTNLYVKQFPASFEDKDLSALFEPFGTIASVFIKKDDEGKSLGFGFLNFNDHESAQKALTELNGKTLDDPKAEGETFELYVSKGQKKAERSREIKSKVEAMQQEKNAKFSGMNLFVKNLDESIDDAFLKETFSPFGTITSAKIVRDDTANGTPSKGFGFVCFSSPEEASRAVTELNGKILRSKPITVALHQRKEQRRAHLAATYAPRGMRYPQQMGPGQQPMPYGMNMPFQQGFPQQRGPQGFPYGQQPGQFGPRGAMMGRGQGGQQFGFMGPYGAGGMPMPGQPGQMRRPMGGPMGAPQGGRGRPMNQQPRGGPINGGRMQSAGPGGPGMMSQMGGRGPAQQNGIKFNQGVRNQGMLPQMMPMPPQQMPGGGMPVAPAASNSIEPLDDAALAAADPAEQKNMIGERLYPLIYQHQDKLAGKITGMLLEMDNSELLNLIESPDALVTKIQEALTVLEAHEKSVSRE